MGEVGLVVDRLELSEAVTVLLQKAGIHDPCVQDYQTAKAVVELLGCLPLAVDQGGAYIRSRRKTLTAYLHLCQERQNEVLRFRPRLGEYEKSVFTTWEVNFDQVERGSKAASDLLLPFCFLDASNISETMLARACSPQKRWSRLGEMSEIAPMESGIDSELLTTVQDEIKFDDAIEKLLSFSLIHLDNDVNGSRNFSIPPHVCHTTPFFKHSKQVETTGNCNHLPCFSTRPLS